MLAFCTLCQMPEPNPPGNVPYVVVFLLPVSSLHENDSLFESSASLLIEQKRLFYSHVGILGLSQCDCCWQMTGVICFIFFKWEFFHSQTEASAKGITQQNKEEWRWPVPCPARFCFSVAGDKPQNLGHLLSYFMTARITISTKTVAAPTSCVIFLSQEYPLWRARAGYHGNVCFPLETALYPTFSNIKWVLRLVFSPCCHQFKEK